MTMPKFKPVATVTCSLPLNNIQAWVHEPTAIIVGSQLYTADQLTAAYEAGFKRANNQECPDNIGGPALSQQECYRIGYEAGVASIRKSEDVDCFSVSIEAAYEAGKRDAVPEGWKLVPIEPTKSMQTAGWGNDHLYVDLYKAMIAAAPSPEGEVK